MLTDRAVAAHRDIVDRAVDRERADVTAGKEKWRDDIAVGRHHHPTAGDVEGGLVVTAAKPFVVEGLVEYLADELRHRTPPRPMGEIDAPVLDIETVPVGLRAHEAIGG